jgi:arabinan endo-1,5-alpha-L-arabinosidase
MRFRALRGIAALVCCCLLLSCGGGGGSTGSKTPAGPLDVYTLKGDVSPVHDPDIIRQGINWYVFSTDFQTPSGNLPIHCSTDKQTWTACGTVFSQIPAWITQRLPGIHDLWAPEVKFFNGTYHLYYAASVFGTNHSVIALATNTTLDRSDPAYAWVDQGEVIESNPANATYAGDDFNTIDPSILIDNDGSVWMAFGSYWTGIKLRQLDAMTGKLSTTNTAQYALAARPGNTAVEAASLVRHGSFYYLFVSFDTCCQGAASTYRTMVGRSSSLTGSYVDQSGVDMLQGGGTQLLAPNQQWAGPGGETVWIDPAQGDTIVFHAYATTTGAPYLHVNSLTWVNDWPVVQP